MTRKKFCSISITSFTFVLILCLPCWSDALASSSSSSGGGKNNMIDIANMALQNSPSSNRFITNKMCPFAQKVWISLECSNAPYEMEEIDLYGPGGKPDWFWKLNPSGTVPVLVCNGGATIHRDSDLILDAVEKGMVSGSVALYPPNNEDLQKSISEWRQRITKFLPVGKKAVLSGGSSASMKNMLLEMNDAVVGKYLTGDRVTTADCHAFPFLWRIDEQYDLDELSCPKLKDWIDHCSQQPAFQKTIQQSWWWWW